MAARVTRRTLFRYGALGGAAAAAGGFPARGSLLDSAARSARRRRLRARRGDDRRPRTAHEVGRRHRALARRKVHGEDRGPRPQGAGAARGPRDQPRRPRDRRPARRRAQGRQSARSAPRNPGPAEGQHRDRRPDEHDGGIAGAPRGYALGRRLPRREAARGGRRHPRQDQPLRVGQLPLDAFLERLERPRRAVPQSLRARPQPVGIELRFRRRGRREPVRDRRGQRDRRLDRVAVEQLRPRGSQADAGPRLAERNRADLPQPGHRRPDGEERDRRGDPADGARRLRSGGSGDEGSFRPGPGRLRGRARAGPERTRRRAHRGAPQEALRAEPGRGRAGRGGALRPPEARRGHRRPGRHRHARRDRRRASSRSSSTSSRRT